MLGVLVVTVDVLLVAIARDEAIGFQMVL